MVRHPCGVSIIWNCLGDDGEMVYDQTEQNVMEKKKLVNTLLDNYNQATIKFLYYTDEVQEYLNTRQ